MPTASPWEFTSGPPELPGLSGAVCWIMFSINLPSVLLKPLPTALTTPVETVESKPRGLPIAMTRRPDASWTNRPEGRESAPRRLPGSQARSVAGSLPTTLVRSTLPSVKRASTWRAWPMTWWLVRIYPSGAITMPEPARSRRPAYPFWKRTEILTTAGAISSTTRVTALE